MGKTGNAFRQHWKVNKVIPCCKSLQYIVTIFSPFWRSFSTDAICYFLMGQWFSNLCQLTTPPTPATHLITPPIIFPPYISSHNYHMQLKNIIFDLGGVLLDIDYHRPVQEFAALGISSFEDMYSQAAANPLFEQLETGKISNSDFLDAIAALAPQPLTHQQVTGAWNSILLHFRQPSMVFLQALQQRYNIYLLSNTNNIHLEQIQKILQQDTGTQHLDDYFTKAWYSSKLGLRKPERDIYEFVLKDGGLAAAETLFIDDSVQNIEAAAVLGIKTHLLQPSEAIENLHWFT
jgi:glucose-1-phosphatase